jgi:hypothetical protein
MIDFYNYITTVWWSTEDLVTLYTPNQVIDSDGMSGSRVSVINSAQSIQFLQCSKTLNMEKVYVQTDSREIDSNSPHPEIKTYSKWPSNAILVDNRKDTTLIGGEYVSDLIFNAECTSEPVISGQQFYRTCQAQSLCYGPTIPMDLLLSFPVGIRKPNLSSLHLAKSFVSAAISCNNWD